MVMVIGFSPSLQGRSSAAVKARLADLGNEPMPMTPAGFGKFIADETEKWGTVIRAATHQSGMIPHGRIP
jgi:tripartite-type tricarboxylate transporter receptor subunit TctC